jgi:hypothetical protein
MKDAIFSAVKRELWRISGDIALEFEMSQLRLLEVLMIYNYLHTTTREEQISSQTIVLYE